MSPPQYNVAKVERARFDALVERTISTITFTDDWILATNFWNDGGIWDDAETWND